MREGPKLRMCSDCNKLHGGCMDCGIPYGGPGWSESRVHDEDWNEITQDFSTEAEREQAILCVPCILRRAAWYMPGRNIRMTHFVARSHEDSLPGVVQGDMEFIEEWIRHYASVYHSTADVTFVLVDNVGVPKWIKDMREHLQRGDGTPAQRQQRARERASGEIFGELESMEFKEFVKRFNERLEDPLARDTVRRLAPSMGFQITPEDLVLNPFVSSREQAT